jgi:hypothetical protein
VIAIAEQTQQGVTSYTPSMFETRFVEICEEHRAQGRALLFAFLVYDFKHPQIVKVLRDRDYWDSFDYISGSLISVFAFHAPRAKFDSEVNRELPSQSAGVTATVHKYFGVQGPIPMPSLLFFQVAEGHVIGSVFAKLKESTIEDACNEIRKILTDVTDVLGKVTPENYGNAQEILNLVSHRLKARPGPVEFFRQIKESFTAAELTKLVLGW